MDFGKRITFRQFNFSIHNNVYEPAEDTFLIAHNIRASKNDIVLDIGTGCGILAIIASEQAKSVDAIDINPHAIRCAEENAKRNCVENIDFHLGDFFETNLKKVFSLILFNPPYLPSSNPEKKNWLEKAWAGGKNGRTIIDRFITDAPNFLSDVGQVLMVQSSLSDISRTIRNFKKAGLGARIRYILSFPFERIALIEASYL